MKSVFTLLLLTLIVAGGFAQPGALKRTNPYHIAYHDSLQRMDYAYPFPILGKSAYKKGFDVQLPYGVGLVYFAQRQEVLISRTAISFNDGEEIDLSNIIEFGKIENNSHANSFRPSLWVLPFLNVYGIFSTGKSTTDVPLVRPISFTTTQEFKASTAGVGATIAGGIGPVILILDQNYNWVNLDAFVEPVPAYNLDIRLGHNFVNARRADRSITIWFGTFYQKIQNSTKGTILVRDLFPDFPPGKIDEVKQDLQQWYDGLTPVQKAILQPLIQHIEDYFDGNNPGDGRINYNLDKKLAGPWNLIFGAQYQHNKHWQIRTEVGTYGKRTQFLLNLNYSFVSFKRQKK